MFRFSIRELVLLTAVVGLSVALWIQHRTATLWQSRANSAAAAVDYAGWGLTWEGENAVIIKPGDGKLDRVQFVVPGR